MVNIPYLNKEKIPYLNKQKIPKVKENIIPASFSIIPFGQFIARIFYLDGSLDKWWLLIPIFYIPPFSLIAFFVILFGGLKKGKGGKPYDWYIAIPISLLIIFKLINLTSFGDKMIIKIFGFILIFGSIMSILLWRRYNLINKNFKEKNKEKCDKTYNHKILINEFVNSINIYGITILVMYIIQAITTFIFKTTKFNVIFDLLLFPIALFCVYVFNNMLEQKDLKEVCIPDWWFNSKQNIVLFVFSIISILISFFIGGKKVNLINNKKLLKFRSEIKKMT